MLYLFVKSGVDFPWILRVKPEVPAGENGENAEAVAGNGTQTEESSTHEEEGEEPDMWEETFKSHVDSKPNGPESVGLDVTFHDFQHVYGIPQHADHFTLKTTTLVDFG